MAPEVEIHFDSIESAHDFVALLSQAVADTRREIEGDVQREPSGNSARRLEALRLASYMLGRLELHTARSARILNDLRSLRRLLFEERRGSMAIAQPKPTATPTLSSKLSPSDASTQTANVA